MSQFSTIIRFVAFGYALKSYYYIVYSKITLIGNLF